MSALLATLRVDLRLQARNRLYAIGLAVAVAMGLLVRALVPEAYAGRTLAGLYVAAVGGTTGMFGAAMVLLARSDQTLAALRVTQLGTVRYAVSKAVTLTGFSFVESMIVYGIAAHDVPTRLPLLVLGLLLLGLLFTLFGIGLAAPFDSITRFLLPTATFAGLAMQLPILWLVGVGNWAAWGMIPTNPALVLLVGAFEPLSTAQWVYAGLGSALALALAWAFCLHRFRAHVRLDRGARRCR